MKNSVKLFVATLVLSLIVISCGKKEKEVEVVAPTIKIEKPTPPPAPKSSEIVVWSCKTPVILDFELGHNYVVKYECNVKVLGLEGLEVENFEAYCWILDGEDLSMISLYFPEEGRMIEYADGDIAWEAKDGSIREIRLDAHNRRGHKFSPEALVFPR